MPKGTKIASSVICLVLAGTPALTLASLCIRCRSEPHSSASHINSWPASRLLGDRVSRQNLP